MIRTDGYQNREWMPSAARGKNSSVPVKKQPENSGNIPGCSTTEYTAEVSSRPDDIRSYIDYLESLVPGREIVIADLAGKEEISKYALAGKGSFQIVISAGALEKMRGDPAFEKQCLDALREARQAQAGKLAALPMQGKTLLGCGLVLDEEGSVSQWVMSQKQAAPQKKPSSFVWQTEKKDGSFIRIKTDKGCITIQKKKPGYTPSKDLVKIARAGSRQAVRTTMAGIRAQIYQLKSGGGEPRVKAVLVKQAEQVLGKARTKEKLLRKEELLKLQQKRSAQKAQYRKSLHLKLLLKQKQSARKVREYGQIRDYYETPEERRLEKEQERLGQEAMVESGAVSGQIYSPAGDPSGGISIASDSLAGISLDISV